jgi:hypothetical protein
MKAVKISIAVVLVILAAGLIAPYIPADSYGDRLRASLERSLGRKVEIRGPVRFNLFRGPGFSADDVVIHEDPSIGFEPIAYMDSVKVRPSLLSLLGARFVIASVRLEGATINLTKSGGIWNFTSFMDRSVMSSVPALHVRNGRINFKFGDTKSIFYLMATDLDISPPGSLGGGWNVSCAAQAARTDKPALGLGSFALDGKWFLAPERVDLDLRIEPTQLENFAALMSGDAGGIHGEISSRLRLAGPLNGIGILGRLTIRDVHRWDLLPPKDQGWPMDIRGRLDLTAQQLELQSTSSVVPVTTRFRSSDYLTNPRWGVTMTWNRFPAAPIMQLARDMGAQFPPNLRIEGTIDGAVGYAGDAGYQGQFVLHDTAITIPDSPPVRLEEMRIMLDRQKMWLAPALVHTAEGDEARLEGTYSLADGMLDLSISTAAMRVASLKAQAALAAVPWLEQLSSGDWSGQLHYHREALGAGWSGTLQLTDGEASIPGLANPLVIASARVGIDGMRVAIDRMQASAGKIAFTGDYRYEPGTARPHRLRLRAARLTAGDLETELLPTLSRSSSLLARALGRSGLPVWLRDRKVQGSIQIGDLEIGDAHLQNVRARLLWDVARVELPRLEARLDRATFNGALTILLNEQRPTYKLTAKMQGLNWQTGKLDAEGTLETSGTGQQLSARLRLTDLSLHIEDEVYTGSGAAQDDGRLRLFLTSGAKEMRMIGTLAALKVDPESRP